jgi:hypothetical protein
MIFLFVFTSPLPADEDKTPGQIAAQAARELGMTVRTICVEKPLVTRRDGHTRGGPRQGHPYKRAGSGASRNRLFVHIQSIFKR